VIVLFFLAPVALMPTGYSVTQLQHWQTLGHTIFTEGSQAGASGRQSIGLTPQAMAYLVFLYSVSMFFATFFNVAFYNEILAALRGKSVSIAHGLTFAVTKLKAIFMWSLLAGIVGIAIKALEQRLGFIGRIIVRFIGVAWSIASVFAVPIIVCDDEAENPVRTLKRSADLLKRTWGEALIGYVGMSFASGLIIGGSVIFLLVVLFLSIALGNPWIIALTAVFWFVGLVVFSYLMGVAGQVYKGALYLYAAEGTVAHPYSKDMFDTAWKFKKQ
jgi:hypothetical protein